MKTPLWEPTQEVKQQTNMMKFLKEVNVKYGLSLASYADLHQWSVDRIEDFWAAVWDFTEIKYSLKYTAVVEDLSVFPGTKWFPGAKLNFAENLLRFCSDDTVKDKTAFIAKGENQVDRRMTYAQLYDEVARFAKSLRDLGIKPGDRVVGYMPNLPETAIAMLAATSLGAVWSACATDLGTQAALDRLGQVEPRVMITADGYFYKGKPFDSFAKAVQVANSIPSLEKVVVVSFTGAEVDMGAVAGAVKYEDFLDANDYLPLAFEQLPFDHPVFIMFSSGTTGKPKCMVQGPGVMLNHLKELVIHSDLCSEDTIFYITTCSWMMWNWLLSSLAVGATVVLYDGMPMYPETGEMFKLVQDEKISIFGLSASYVNFIRNQQLVPGQQYDLSSLRQISQTGSALSDEGFEWIYSAVKKDLHLNSISGGTDINGCFALGSPAQPVYAGELQGPGLGMRVVAYDKDAQPVFDQEGELVCEAPSPSMPLYFWNDKGNEKYMDAYFTFYTHKRVWRHGDYILIHGDTGGITFYGRSDAILMPSGVRIGTAEIYNILEEFPEITDSLAIGQDWKGDERVLLFVQLAPGAALDDDLLKKIKTALRTKGSPRHVPAVIMETPDIPYTFSGKKVEGAVKNIIHQRKVTNRDALRNPDSLTFYEKLDLGQ